MILGIGTDLASIARIEETLEKHGQRFVERCFSPEEIESIQKHPADQRAARYAKRWAAKEACAKALGLGIREDIFLKDIVVINDEAGKPHLILRGGAKDRLTAITPVGKTSRIDISLSDERLMALAFVVISTE